MRLLLALERWLEAFADRLCVWFETYDRRRELKRQADAEAWLDWYHR
jgi:hypothetical protein